MLFEAKEIYTVQRAGGTILPHAGIDDDDVGMNLHIIGTRRIVLLDNADQPGFGVNDAGLAVARNRDLGFELRDGISHASLVEAQQFLPNRFWRQGPQDTETLRSAKGEIPAH